MIGSTEILMSTVIFGNCVRIGNVVPAIADRWVDDGEKKNAAGLIVGQPRFVPTDSGVVRSRIER